MWRIRVLIIGTWNTLSGDFPSEAAAQAFADQHIKRTRLPFELFNQ